MKTKDCPLCGERDALRYIDQHVETIVSPALPGTIGNVQYIPATGSWDYSHGQRCLKLTYAIKKIALLRFYANEVNDIVSDRDRKTAEGYNDLLSSYGLRIEGKGLLHGEKWDCILFVKQLEYPYKERLHTKGIDFDEAFVYLKHRLLCGDILESYNGINLQFQQDEKGKISIVQLG